MAKWVIGVAGIAIISVLADVILPVGQTRKYIKTVMGIVITLVVAQPVFSLLKTGKIDFQTESSETALQPQQQYLQYVQASKGTHTKEIQNALQQAGFLQPVVTYDVSSGCYNVIFCEPFSETLQQAAQNALSDVAAKTQFVWDGGDT